MAWGDYGYMEDDRKPGYDWRLIRRAGRYARPYALVLVITCLLILTATAADLALPYITKMAVDRYIVVAARQVDAGRADTPALEALVEKNMEYFTATGQKNAYYLKPSRSEKMDPRDLKRLENAGVVRQKGFYIVDDPAAHQDLIDKYRTSFRVYPQVAAIATKDLDAWPKSDLARLRRGDLTGLARLALIAALILVTGYVLTVAQVVVLEFVGQRMTHALRQDLAAHVFHQSLSFHDQNPTARLVARITNDIQNISEMIKTVAVTFFKDIFILVGILGLLFYIDLRLALITTIVVPLILGVTMIFRRKARDVFRELRHKVSEINAVFGETISGLRVVQAFVRERENMRRFEKLNHENYLAGLRQIKVFAVFMPLIDLFAAASLGVIIWYGGLGVITGTMTLGVVVAFIGYVRKFFQPIRELAEKFNILQSAMASLERIFNLMDHHQELPEPDQPLKIARPEGPVRFDSVTFGYNPGEPVLKDVSFEVRPGRTLAIVGPTGSGKTSIINLLLRFYDPQLGRVLVGGDDVQRLASSDHRRRIGLVMQDVFMFDGTVRENIALDRHDITGDRIRRAAEAVGADEFIQKLPQKYDQPLGEGGASLSVGQRQLLALARVLVQDPPILILDEATSFVDSETEAQIEKAVSTTMAGRTTIVIAHRLSTIRHADQILVLYQGRAVESGSHRELMEQQGLYARLTQIQFGS